MLILASKNKAVIFINIITIIYYHYTKTKKVNSKLPFYINLTWFDSIHCIMFTFIVFCHFDLVKFDHIPSKKNKKSLYPSKVSIFII